MNKKHSNTNKYRKNIKVIRNKEYQGSALDVKVELIRELIPLGLMHVEKLLQEEIKELAGARYSRGQYSRYGSNPGSVVLADQRLAIDVPRVRDKNGDQDVPLKIYQELHQWDSSRNGTLDLVLKGISCRDYKSVASSIPEAFGLSSSTVSRQFIRATKKKLKGLLERSLTEHDFIVMWMDGKTFAKDNLIAAVGLTVAGDKVILGFIEAGSENKQVVSDFLKELLSRGMNIGQGILVVVDGAKGFKAAIQSVFKGKHLLQRCQWHKRENIVSYLPKSEQASMRKRLQRSYEQPTYQDAKKELVKIREELEQRNLSAVNSLDDGFEETLTIHKLGLFRLLGKSLKTTNVIESINSMVEQRCGKVDYWKNSSQRQRWLAATLLDIEPRLNRIHGFRHLAKLRKALQNELGLNENILMEAA